MEATNTLTNLAAQVADATDIRDIHPLVAIPNPWLWAWVGLGILALAALAFWAWRKLGNRPAAPPPPPPIPAHILARQRLEAAMALIQKPKPFIIKVSDTLRFYLEEAFNLRATEQTTEEFLVALRHNPRLSEGQKTSLGDFLESCDLVKFAKYEPRESELRELHHYALELVNQTAPKADPEAEAESASGWRIKTENQSHIRKS